MAVSQNQRLRKAAAKAAKRKAVVAKKLAEERHALRIPKPIHVNLETSPIAGCWLTRNIEGLGSGELTVARKLPLGRFAVALFVVDVWCLGVTETYFSVEDSEDFDYRLEDLQKDCEPLEPARARLLLQDAVAYGEANGFRAASEYDDTARLLSDVEPAGEPFAFGDAGRPHYVIMPYDSPRRTASITAKLTATLGPNGFDITYPREEDDGGIEYENDMGWPPA